MTLTPPPFSSNEPKEKPRRASVRPGKNLKSKVSQPRTVRLTVSLPIELVERLRDAVYWSPGLTLAWLMAQSLRLSLQEMEALRQSPFPKRTNALRAGRPRLLGQTMYVPLRTKLPDGSTHPSEIRTQPKMTTQPSLE